MEAFSRLFPRRGAVRRGLAAKRLGHSPGTRGIRGNGSQAIVTGASQKTGGRINDKGGPALLCARAECMTMPSEILPLRSFPPIPHRVLSVLRLCPLGRRESRGRGPSTVAGPPPLSQCYANKVSN